MALYSRRWTRQPQEAAGIDWDSPLASGLYSAMLPSAGPFDLAGGAPFAVAGARPAIVQGGPGMAYQFDGSSCLYRSTLREDDGFNATQLVIFEPARLTADEAILGMDDAGSGRNYIFFVATAGGDPIYAGVRNDSNNSANASSGASGAAVGVPLVVVAQYAGPASRSIWINGTRRGTSVISLTGMLTPDFVSYGAGYKSSAPASPTNGRLYFAAQWSRALSDEEVAQVSKNPWQLFAPRRIWVPQAAIAGLPTLSLPTYAPGSLTGVGFRPRVTAT